MKSVFYSNETTQRLALVSFNVHRGLKKLLLVVLAVTFLMATGATQDYTVLGTLGTAGTGEGQFNNPMGIAVDASHKIFVTDYGNHRVQVFDGDGGFIRQFGSDGSTNGKFHYPTCIATDTEGNIYVGDYYGVQVFSNDGTYLRRQTVNYVTGIALDATGNVYISTSFALHIYNNALTQKIRSVGSNGSQPGQFDNARGVAVDKNGRIFIADLFNKRIQVLTNEGTYITQFGTAGTGDGQFTSPTGVAIDGSGFIYVTDEGNNRLQVFDPVTFAFVKKFGSTGTANGQFKSPQQITLDDRGYIFISEYWNNRVQVLSKAENVIQTSVTITKTYGDNDFELTATNNSQQQVQFSKINDPANTGDITITGTTVHIVKAGTVKIRAHVADDFIYMAANKEITLTINKATQTVTFDPLEPLIEGETGFILTASSSSTLPVTFDSNNPAVATVEGDVVTIKGIGTATITSYQDGNENYEAAPNVQRELVVNAITGVHPQVEAITEVYPVPSHDLVNVRSRLVTPSTRVVILDSFGHRMEELTPSAIEENTLQVSVKHLPAGMYYLQLSGASTITERIVKN